jgi:hypothetical protein
MSDQVTSSTAEQTQGALQSGRTLNAEAVGGTDTKVNGADIKHVGLEITGKEDETKLNALLKNFDTINTGAVGGKGVTIVGGKIESTGLKL